MRNKLFSLNLALFMLVVSVIPVFAMENNEEKVLMEQQSFLAQYDMIDMKVKNKNEQLFLSIQEYSKDNEEIELYSSKSSEYNIVVGGNSFSSIYNAKGNGWEYDAEYNTLFINGYNGSGIRASGDLVIYASGVNEITGSTSTYYGSDGIISTGNLDVIIVDGTTSVSGGNGFYRGGDGIYSDSYAFVYTFAGASLIVEGGDTAQTSTAGGNAIYGEIAHILGEGFVRAIGGDGTSLYSNGCAGGCALIGNEVYVESSCELIGGEGYYAGPGIYFGSYCEMGVVNATISCGKGQYNKYAIQSSEGQDWYYNNHTIVSGGVANIKVSIRQYILKLLGCGGTRGTATFESLKAYYPTSYDLSEYSFQRLGYTQIGWRNASGDLVPLNNLYTPDKDTDLFAEWSPNTYKVIYNSNGGSGSMSNSTHTYDTAKSLTSCAFTKTGYTFAGWATSASGSVLYSNVASVKNLTSTSGGTVTLYAKWTPITYKVAYNANGGSGSMSNSTHTYDTAKSLTSCAFTKTGYTFAGWATSASGSVLYSNVASVKNLTSTSGGTVTLYAKWIPNTYTLIFDANGGAVEQTNKNITYDSTYGTLPTPTRNNYQFKGWYTAKEDGALITDTTKVLTTTVQTLYALWEKLTPYTQIIKNDNSNYSVELFNLDSGCIVIFATYQNDKLVEFYPATYDGNKLPFITTKQFDTIKVMVWNSLNTLKPICGVNSTIIE